ncbi:hypothetical protein [Nonomuraea cavernae]|uniref:hypothetical protein n=1 Tax=Nonomuraea cavernae TaxID=2045107 RepID=UPI0033C1E423
MFDKTVRATADQHISVRELADLVGLRRCGLVEVELTGEDGAAPRTVGEQGSTSYIR